MTDIKNSKISIMWVPLIALIFSIIGLLNGVWIVTSAIPYITTCIENINVPIEEYYGE